MSISAIISRYLFTYRNTPHWVTGECPLTIVFGRKIKTRFDLLKDYGGRSKVQEKYFKGKRELSFEEGEICYARDYTNPNKRA